MSLEIDRNKLAAHIEHTLLRPDVDRESILRLCAEAREHEFHAVCVQGCWVAEARHAIEGSSIQVVTVAGFPWAAPLATRNDLKPRSRWTTEPTKSTWS